MPTIKLPADPSLENLRNQARALQRAVRAGKATAIDRVRRHHPDGLFAFGLGTGDGGPWRARLGDALDSPAAMVRGQLGWAVSRGFLGRVRLLVAHGVDVRSPLGDGRTPIEAAARGGHTGIVELLAEAGAREPGIAGVDALVAACLAADRETVARLVAEDPDLLPRARSERAALVVEAAEGRRVEALPFLTELGFDIDAQLDGALNERLVLGVSGGTALHWAAWRGDLDLARRLLDLGADPDVRDTKFGTTPLDWARHASQDAMAGFLAEPAD